MLGSKLGGFGAFQLQLELVRDQRNEFGIGGLSLGVAHRVAEEALQCIQIAPVPGDLNGMADGSLYPAGGGAEGLGDLGVKHLGNGVDNVHVVDGDDNGLPQILVALDVGGHGIRVGNKSKSKSYYLLV